MTGSGGTMGALLFMYLMRQFAKRCWSRRGSVALVNHDRVVEMNNLPLPPPTFLNNAWAKPEEVIYDEILDENPASAETNCNDLVPPPDTWLENNSNRVAASDHLYGSSRLINRARVQKNEYDTMPPLEHTYGNINGSTQAGQD